MKRVSFHTLGCRLNHSETEVLQRSFEQAGYRIVDESTPAEVCVVNTCTVTEHSDAKNRQVIRAVHRRNPEADIAVIGCYAQMSAEEIMGIEGVALVVGNEEKLKLVEYLDKIEIQDSPLIIPSPESRRSKRAKPGKTTFLSPVVERAVFLPDEEKGKPDYAYRTRASLKIQDGCDFMCSFCIIPFARGRSRHRNFENLLDEAHMLAGEGVKEIVLTGVNLGIYNESGRTLADVVDALNELQDISRIRISSIEPTTVQPQLLEYMADPRHKLLPFLHLPMQSGSKEILRDMKRRYGPDEFAEELLSAWKRLPDLCLGTDVMVGFPGESEEQFEATLKLLADLPLAYFHVFPFSAREGTAAFRMADRVDPETRQRRSDVLRELSRRKRRMFQKAMLGSVREVLFENRKADGKQCGYTDNYMRVALNDPQFPDFHNRVIPVQLTSIKGGELNGFPVLEGQAVSSGSSDFTSSSICFA